MRANSLGLMVSWILHIHQEVEGKKIDWFYLVFSEHVNVLIALGIICIGLLLFWHHSIAFAKRFQMVRNHKDPIDIDAHNAIKTFICSPKNEIKAIDFLILQKFTFLML